MLQTSFSNKLVQVMMTGPVLDDTTKKALDPSPHGRLALTLGYHYGPISSARFFFHFWCSLRTVLRPPGSGRTNVPDRNTVYRPYVLGRLPSHIAHSAWPGALGRL